MYMYCKEKNIYFFDGDLEQYLLDKGVESAHIETMKRRILQENKNEYYSSYCLNGDKIKKEIRLVPLAKVIGTGRGTVGESVFENVRTMKAGEREPRRFKECLGYFDYYPSLEQLKISYEKEITPVDMDYYTEDDEYYLVNGNHRTLTAMLVGADNIIACVTKKFCNHEKKKNFFAAKKFYKEFNILKIQERRGKVEIIFEGDGECYVVRGFSPRREGEDCYQYIEKLSSEIRGDLKKVKFFKYMPKVIGRYFAQKCENRRIIQYIEKYKYKRDDTDVGNKTIYLYNY